MIHDEKSTSATRYGARGLTDHDRPQCSRLLAADLARIYGVETRALNQGVETRALNQAVKRNRNRFPADFAFRLTRREMAALQRSRSQSVILKRGTNVKYAPLAFTEHGAIMAATVLNSPRAVDMSVFVVRAFARLRDIARTHVELSRQLDQLERRVTAHDEGLTRLFTAVRRLLQAPATPTRRIGFRAQMAR